MARVVELLEVVLCKFILDCYRGELDLARVVELLKVVLCKFILTAIGES